MSVLNRIIEIECEFCGEWVIVKSDKWLRSKEMNKIGQIKSCKGCEQ